MMNNANNIFKLFRIFLLAVFLLASVIQPADAHGRDDGKYSSVVDESGNTVYVTAWLMQVGDQVLTEDNKRYEVIAIEGDTARAKLIGQVDLAYYAPEGSFFGELAGFFEPSVAEAQQKGKIAVYHTHSDESYVPTDNKESIAGAGGIYKVGQAFKSAMEKNGLAVALSETKHDPHDDMAYERSRRTAMALIKNDKPDAIFDIHRDAVPPEVYKGTVHGQEIAKLQLVVGKHGPTGKQIEEYALQIKAAADKKHPGLVKGIFFAKGGDYNQDLHPRSMLIEAGAHTNDRAAAEKGVAMFADVVPMVLGKTGGGAAAATNNVNKAQGAPGGANQAGVMGTVAGRDFSGASKSIALIIGLVVIGSVAFLYLSTGSWKEAKSKLRQFVTTEFANFLGPRRKAKDKKVLEIRKKRKD